MQSPPPNPNASVIPVGVSLAGRLSFYSPSDWEEFILEWMQGFRPEYFKSERLGGAGDLGRDVVGYVASPIATSAWDNYQCKHYARPLQPSDIWVELGKLCYHSSKGAFTPPRKYRFVAPNEVSPSLKDLLKKPEQLRDALKANWQKYCEKGITETEQVQLQGGLLDYVDGFDFTIIGYETLQEVLVQHARTPFWSQRFQLALPARPAPVNPPDTPQPSEARYVQQLLVAYSDAEARQIEALDHLKEFPAHHEHFQRSRRWFYAAESLHRFTRDQLRPGAFDRFKQQIYDGVVDTAQSKHSNALERLKATTSKASSLQLAQDEIAQIAEVGDKQGVCHHLANENKLTWKP